MKRVISNRRITLYNLGSGLYIGSVLYGVYVLSFSFAQRSRENTINIAMDKELSDLLDFSAVSNQPCFVSQTFYMVSFTISSVVTYYQC